MRIISWRVWWDSPALFGDDHLSLELVELGPQRVVVEQNLGLPAHL